MSEPLTISHEALARLCDYTYTVRGSKVRSHLETDIVEWPTQNGYHVLCIRGTEFSTIHREPSNILDVIRDIQIRPWQCPITKVWAHRGFIRGAYDWLAEFGGTLDPKAKYVITGHSLGAGIAPHMARYMRLRGFDVCEVVLFGEPAGHYWGSQPDYHNLGIPTTSYRMKNDWIRWAGFGKRTVKRTILPAADNCWKGHDIQLYAKRMRHRKWIEDRK